MLILTHVSKPLILLIKHSKVATSSLCMADNTISTGDSLSVSEF